MGRSGVASVSDVVFGRSGIPVLTAAEAAERDRVAYELDGVRDGVLMENAGRVAALIVDRLYPRGRVVAAVGGGNNGGDGIVLLRTLRAWGRDVAFLPVGPKSPDQALLHRHEVPAIEVGMGDREALANALSEADILVDALLGTGASGAPREPVATVIRALNSAGRPIVALDLPSGVDPTTGEATGSGAGAVVRADCTISFGWPKQGLLFHPARAYTGRLIVAEIGFPPFDPGDSTGWLGRTGAELLTPDWARARLPSRPPTAHKGVAGRLLVVGGGEGMAGAALIAAESALRAGAGYLWLAASPANRVPLQTALPEAICVDYTDRAALTRVSEGAAAVLIGPGLGVGDEAASLLEAVLRETPGKPLLIDADALNILADRPELRELAATERELVMTPHAGEMSRLTGLGVEEITADPVGVAGEYAERWRCVVLLKGAPSMIAAPGEPVLINTVGSSDLARAGMGDQLAGAIGAFLAAGAATSLAGSLGRTAAGLGLFYSGRAADLAGLGRSLGPREVSAMLHRAFADPGPAEPPLGLPFITFDQSARR